MAGKGLFLAANTETKTHLSGRIKPQSNDNDLNTIGKLFSNYLAGENQTLVVTGSSVQPDGSDGPVNWLSTAFKTLTLTVTLPGQKFKVRTDPAQSTVIHRVAGHPIHSAVGLVRHHAGAEPNLRPANQLQQYFGHLPKSFRILPSGYRVRPEHYNGLRRYRHCTGMPNPNPTPTSRFLSSCS